MNRSEAVKLLLSYGADPKNVVDSETNNGFIHADTLNEVFYESNAMYLIREALRLPLETKMPEGCRIRRRVEWIKERSWTARDENGDEEKHLAGHCKTWNCEAGQDGDKQDDDDTEVSDCPVVKFYRMTVTA